MSSEFPDIFLDAVARLRAADDLEEAEARAEADASLDAMSLRYVLRELDRQGRDISAESTDDWLSIAQAIDYWAGEVRRRWREATLSPDEDRLFRRLERGDPLNADPTAGHVLFKRSLWGRWSGDEAEPDELAGSREDRILDLFRNLIVLPPAVPGTEPDDENAPNEIGIELLRVLPGEARLPRGATWKVGFAPLALEAGDLALEALSDGGAWWYRVVPGDLAARAAASIRALDGQGCHFAVFPETVLKAEGLAAVQAALADLPSGTSLCYVLVGIVAEDPAGGLPFNRACLLDRDGEVVAQQDKLTRWNLNADQCARYGVPVPEGVGQAKEYMQPGGRILIVEIENFGRLSILICEDLRRGQPGGWLGRHGFLDLKLAPVLDQSLDLARDCWSVEAGCNGVGSGVGTAISNSLVLTLRQNAYNRETKNGYPERNPCGFAVCIEGKSAGVRPKGRLLTTDLPATGPGVAVVEWDVTRFTEIN